MENHHESFHETLEFVQSLKSNLVVIPNLKNFEESIKESSVRDSILGNLINDTNPNCTILYCEWIDYPIATPKERNRDDGLPIQEPRQERKPVRYRTAEYAEASIKLVSLDLQMDRSSAYGIVLEHLGKKIVDLNSDDVLYIIDCKEPVISTACSTLASTYLPGKMVALGSEKHQRPIDMDGVSSSLFQLQQYIHSVQPNHLCKEFSNLKSGSSCKAAELITRYSQTNQPMPILLLGESGVGKTWWARILATLIQSNRRPAKGIVVKNCAAIPSNLLESELFGHKKGAFTGATEESKGAFAEADGGVLFLDEIADMPFELQAKLLTSLTKYPDKTGYFYTPVGATTELRSDFRLVCATRKDIKQEVRDERFREDLFYRIAGFIVTIPPLRERKEDLEELIKVFSSPAGSGSISGLELDSKILTQLLEYKWPGNIRELEFVIRKLAFYKDLGNKIDQALVTSVLEDGSLDAGAGMSLHGNWNVASGKELVNLFRSSLATYMVKSHGTQDKAAKALGIDVSTLQLWQKPEKETKNQAGKNKRNP